MHVGARQYNNTDAKDSQRKFRDPSPARNTPGGYDLTDTPPPVGASLPREPFSAPRNSSFLQVFSQFQEAINCRNT